MSIFYKIKYKKKICNNSHLNRVSFVHVYIFFERKKTAQQIQQMPHKVLHFTMPLYNLLFDARDLFRIQSTL